MRRKLRQSLAPLLGLLLFAVALWALHHELQTFHYRDLVRHVHSISVGHLALALLLTGLSYFALTGYDALAMFCSGVACSDAHYLPREGSKACCMSC
jgi:phosphatidylglycerol lysyltransferase